MKISSFIVALVVVSIVISGLAYFYFGIGDAYGLTYDNSTFSTYEDLSTMKTISDNINSTIDSLNPNNPIDLIGGFLQGGYQVLKFTKTSFSVFTGMSEDGFDKIGDAVGGPGFANIKSGLLIIAFIAFAFIIVSVLVGREV